MNPLFIKPIIDIASSIFDRLIPDAAAAQKAKDEFAAVTQGQDFQVALAQIAVNVEEAKSPSLWVAGWRPFIGWTCGVAFAYATVLEPFARFICTVVFSYAGTFPHIEIGVILSVLGGMLGMGGLRTYEKYAGVARDGWLKK